MVLNILACDLYGPIIVAKISNIIYLTCVILGGLLVISNRTCSIKGLSIGTKDYTKELKIVECTSFLGQTS